MTPRGRVGRRWGSSLEAVPSGYPQAASGPDPSAPSPAGNWHLVGGCPLRQEPQDPQLRPSAPPRGAAPPLGVAPVLRVVPLGARSPARPIPGGGRERRAGRRRGAAWARRLTSGGALAALVPGLQCRSLRAGSGRGTEGFPAAGSQLQPLRSPAAGELVYAVIFSKLSPVCARAVLAGASLSLRPGGGRSLVREGGQWSGSPANSHRPHYQGQTIVSPAPSCRRRPAGSREGTWSRPGRLGAGLPGSARPASQTWLGGGAGARSARIPPRRMRPRGRAPAASGAVRGPAQLPSRRRGAVARGSLPHSRRTCRRRVAGLRSGPPPTSQNRPRRRRPEESAWTQGRAAPGVRF